MHPSVRDWQVASRCEPALRVGVVLDKDALPELEIVVPDTACALTSLPDGPAERPLRGTSVRARRNGGGVQLEVGGADAGTAEHWCLSPVRPAPLSRGAGILVRGVVAGRNFHWRKRVDQTLTGCLELRAGSQGLLLVNELPLEEYLAGVITAEMSGACPADLLKAQGIVARSWLLAFTEHMHDGEPFERCNDDCCQRYQGTGDLTEAALQAVADTRGLVLIGPHGGVVDANYSKSCGGISELPEHIWGITKPGLSSIVDGPADDPAEGFAPWRDERLDEYLQGEWLQRSRVYCSPNVVPRELFGRYLGRVDEIDDYYRWHVRYRRSDLEELFQRKLPAAAGLTRLLDLRVTKRGVSGRATEIAVEFEQGSERRVEMVADQYRIRDLLSPTFLFSSAFAVRITRDAAGVPRDIVLQGAGWGHGAGLCQIGALGMALLGMDGESICRHYFPTADLRRVYP